ncbi:efflux transporter outer membrane subunit [Variovorax sp. J22G73]|jgi:NodT family efflux transporter outer membrane factor (OMF) lipoprotein|uniref:efflux transporter outer membrane subunit n=1 Tax=unclassified Variovorax TaxID=663243 RepID=UPI000D5F8426|nr:MULTISPECIES: efflux transporter outer membrane subunit [unclassified Variovorax]MDM0006711.1 efflux transporter outer membrane subunit [Variovorax sp. J22R203]MDM0097265.1 efflux transporter outer membrane subunit [Variovorax sp. J22G73]
MKNTRLATPAGLLLAATAMTSIAALGGCAVGPDYVRPPLKLPASYTATPAPASTDPAQAEGVPLSRLSPELDVSAQWWQAFRSEPLNALVVQSLAGNPNIEAADAALRVAQENEAADRAAFWPSVGVGYSPTRQRVADAVASPVASNANLYTLHTAQVTVSYAPDVFGGTRRQVESAQAQTEQQRFQSVAAKLSLSSNVVAAAITEASLRAQQRATQAIVADQKEVLQAYRKQQQLGQVALADVDAQEASLAATEATLPPLDKQLAQQRNLLATLAGRYPSEGVAAQFDLDALQLPTELPLTLPSTLVEHRPDVRAAEAQLQAASAAIGVAVAARLPNVTLGVNYGSSAYTLSQLFKSSSLFWTLAASVTQPVFDGGALRHKEAAARAAFDQAAAQYRATVLGAFRDVANTLEAIDADTRTLQAALKAERTASQSLARTRTQVRLGDASALSLRVAQQAQQQAQLNLVQARALRLTDAAALFQALGGGWWNAPPAQLADSSSANTTQKPAQP